MISTFLARFSPWALGFAAMLTFALVQTIRIEGIHVWPLNIAGLKAENAVLRSDLERVKDAQIVAEALALKAKLDTEAHYRAIAEGIDHDADLAIADAATRADRYIAAHRVRGQASCDPPRSPAPATGDSSPEGADRPGAGAVVVLDDDVRICSENTVRLQQAQSWALGL